MSGDMIAVSLIMWVIALTIWGYVSFVFVPHDN
jgi:hypothetical protein